MAVHCFFCDRKIGLTESYAYGKLKSDQSIAMCNDCKSVWYRMLIGDKNYNLYLQDREYFENIATRTSDIARKEILALLDGDFENMNIVDQEIEKKKNEKINLTPEEVEKRRIVAAQAAEDYRKAEEEKARLLKEKEDKIKEEIKMVRDLPVTTTDISSPYKVIGPIITNTSNKGIFSSAWNKLQKKYTQYPFSNMIVEPSTSSTSTSELGMAIFTTLFDPAFGFEGRVGQSNFDQAFYICMTELKLRCLELGGDAIVGMKMDFDLDTSNYGAFYLQMYGTAVKLKKE